MLEGIQSCEGRNLVPAREIRGDFMEEVPLQKALTQVQEFCLLRLISQHPLCVQDPEEDRNIGQKLSLAYQL